MFFDKTPEKSGQDCSVCVDTAKLRGPHENKEERKKKMMTREKTLQQTSPRTALGERELE